MCRSHGETSSFEILVKQFYNVEYSSQKVLCFDLSWYDNDATFFEN